jgi:hypothetical protein
MAEDENRDFAIDRFQLLQSRQNEDGRFTVTRFGLTQDIHAEDSLWDTFLLHCEKGQS